VLNKILHKILSNVSGRTVSIAVFLCFEAMAFSQTIHPATFHFQLIYETLKPVELESGVLYYAESKKSRKAKDSVLLNIHENEVLPDSILFENKWKYPGYLQLKLKFKDKTRIGDPFPYSMENSNWDAVVGDTAVHVRLKLSDNSLASQSSLKGIALILQAIFEMILALLISRILGFPPIIILMVITANIASFPIYLIQLPDILNRELLVFLIKTIVMSLVGMRKMAIYKIIFLSILLNLISFGLKEILFFVIQLL
jgi:hypothetical protein